jgi:hypothetical protein
MLPANTKRGGGPLNGYAILVLGSENPIAAAEIMPAAARWFALGPFPGIPIQDPQTDARAAPAKRVPHFRKALGLVSEREMHPESAMGRCSTQRPWFIFISIG